ncbi:MAG: zf-TFIIB domain-containing protein [Desulfobacterales bacterium]|jgi:Zn-finger nucleic acid-binding protein
MNCPNCKKPLSTCKIGSVTVDECASCRGIWFDKNELEEAKDEIDPDLTWIDLRIWHRQPRFRITPQPHDCPKCKNVTMQLITYEQPDVDISYCPSCEGSWLNSGDFEKIIDALSKEADSKSASDYVKESLNEASDILTHPQNLISEWHDLKAVLRLLSYRIFVENPKLKSILLGIQKSLPL